MPVRLSALLVLVACANDGLEPPRGLSYAVAMRSCAPNDGPAVAIYLSAAPAPGQEPAPPYLNISVWQPLSALNGSWSVSSNSPQAVASYYSSGTNFEAASEGTVTITSVSSDNTVTGSIDATFPNAGQVRGGFTARWLDRQILCG